VARLRRGGQQAEHLQLGSDEQVGDRYLMPAHKRAAVQPVALQRLRARAPVISYSNSTIHCPRRTGARALGRSGRPAAPALLLGHAASGECAGAKPTSTRGMAAVEDTAALNEPTHMGRRHCCESACVVCRQDSMRPATPGARAGSLSGSGRSRKALRRLRAGGRRPGRACRAAARVSAPCSASERLAGRPAMPASTRFHTCRGRRRASVGALRGRRRAVRMHAVRASLPMRAAAPCAAAPFVHISELAASYRCVRGGVRSAGQARGGHAPD